VAGQLDEAIQCLEHDALSTCLQGKAMEEYNAFTKQAANSALMVRKSIVNLHLQVNNWKKAGEGKVAQDFLAEQRSNTIAITDALTAFSFIKIKASVNKMDKRSLAGLSAHRIIVPLSFHVLLQG